MDIRKDIQRCRFPPCSTGFGPPLGPKPCLPKCLHWTNQQGKGTRDDLLPLGDWLLFFWKMIGHLWNVISRRLVLQQQTWLLIKKSFKADLETIMVAPMLINKKTKAKKIFLGSKMREMTRDPFHSMCYGQNWPKRRKNLKKDLESQDARASTHTLTKSVMFLVWSQNQSEYFICGRWLKWLFSIGKKTHSSLVVTPVSQNLYLDHY